jgi:recombination protein RecR
MLPPALDKVATLLSRLPGVGKRTAMRWAFHILSEPPSYAEGLKKALGELLEHVHFCRQCHHLAETEVCAICRDTLRDTSLLCVVEGVVDLLAIERTGSFRGRYHVLHGALAPLKGVGPSQLRLDNLEERVRAQVTEVIIATSADVEGEATALYLAKRLAPLGVSVSRIATGIPMGGELEYLDDHTLSRALAGRTRVG